ncbi:hypothetical protein J6590_083035 [Homalodisca vitripennis]|nr:hypothetical protein J6590_083035 [Homalodisca vitripennis]
MWSRDWREDNGHLVHQRLMEGLQRLDFEILMWVESYLRNRKQFVKLNNHCSELIELITGRFYINSVSASLSLSSYLMSQLAKYRHVQLLKIIYFGLVESRLRYGFLVWGSAPQNLLKRVFVLQKKLRVFWLAYLAEVNAFKEHSILTFQSLYINETIIYARFHCVNVVDRAAIHDQNTTARVDLRHRSALAGGLPQNSGARFFWKLPSHLKNITEKNDCNKTTIRIPIRGLFLFRWGVSSLNSTVLITCILLLFNVK